MELRDKNTTSNDVITSNSPKSAFTKQRLLKNLLVLCVSFILSFCASEGWAALQSTMNSQEGVGVVSMAVQYSCGCISALFLPKYLIQKYGPKVVIICSLSSCIPYLVSNFYPKFSVMIPFSIVMGFATPLIWGSLCIYLNNLSILYAELKPKTVTNEPVCEEPVIIANKLKESPPIFYGSVRKHRDSILITKPCKLIDDRPFQSIQLGCDEFKKSLEIANRARLSCISEDVSFGSSCFAENETPVEDKISSRVDSSTSILESIDLTNSHFFGWFGGVFLTSFIWSNTISYFVLNSGTEEVAYVRNGNCSCGANFCDVQSFCFQHNLNMPSDMTRYILAGIYVSMSVISVVILFLFLDEISAIKDDVTFSSEIVLATFKFHQNKKQLLLFPLSFYIGLQQAFVYGDYSKDFVGCAWGVNHVALVNISVGCASSFSSYLSGWLEKYLGRRLICLIVITINIAADVLMLLWTPDSSQPGMMFLTAIMLGTVTSVLWCQQRAFIGVAFEEEKEAAFGSYQFWHALGVSVCFAYSNYLCTYVKIYIMLTVSIIAFTGYLICLNLFSFNKNEE